MSSSTKPNHLADRRAARRSARAAHALRTLAAVAALASLHALAACNIAAPIAFALEGPPTVDPIVELDPERPTVIFIDDRGWGDQMIVPTRSLRREIGRVAENTLLAEGVIDEGNMIRSADALRVSTQEDPEQPLSVAQIGRDVGADVVIYVQMTTFSITRDAQIVSPVAAANVSVIDAQNNERIAPEQGFFQAELSLPQQEKQIVTLTRNDRRAARASLAAAFGDRVAKLFYKHERPGRSGTIN